jgi:NAD(P)-dependent dehydrogenase (short-subunit alcohol dehydrogenase family)
MVDDMSGDMRGKVAIVTGASAGIGRATALAFAERGASVVIADIDPRGEEVASEVKACGAEALFVPTDVSSHDEVERMVAAAVSSFGRLDFAFNNAGIEGVPAPLPEQSIEIWHRTLAINLTGVWLCMRSEIPAMLAHGSGAIVNCSSIAGLTGYPNMGAYVASKHGVVGLTKSAALELAATGIRVNAVCPGVIRTEMIDRFTGGDPVATQTLEQSEPMGRMGTPEEVASSVLWLCSDGAGFVTGHALAVDGGYLSR